MSNNTHHEAPEAVRVLVTGGSGFLGGHIVTQLSEDPSIHIAILSRHPMAPSSLANHSRISLHSADLAIEADVKAAFETIKPHAVIHTASPSYLDTTATLLRSNVDGTKALLQVSVACPETRAFVFTSSDSAVVPTQEPLTENDAKLYDETNAPNTYSLTKAVAERMVLAENSAQLHTAVIRIPAIYGENDGNFIPQLVLSIRKREHKMQVGSNTKVFEFLYVNKAAEAHILAMRTLLDPDSAPKAAGEAFFISDSKPEPFFDFARRCYAAAGHPVAPEEVTAIPLPAMQAMASVGEWVIKILTLGTVTPTLRRIGIDHLDTGCCWSLEKAKSQLGYEPVTDQDEAIKKTMEWGMAKLYGGSQ
ncbi:hypothetical protein NM208_g7726 [Fusarium decemcellulare]|uniref:Uncharacterized protein n=1 Tax=Fusarium decemcellulare TaxID=57161 RepID=A0ACC1S871_9HYPO|nr:hypothetical protein NM208_g7726 [Fusarium decemcellulare]